MELHQLRYFVAAAEAGTISRAAERCRVAQPSLSQQIRKLEDGLGVRLFDRLGRGVELTPEGRAFLPRARRILAEVRHAAEDIRRDVDEGAGRLAIGAIPTMAPYLLPPVISPLREAFPRCEISIREDLTEALLEAVADRELDLAVVSTPADHPGIEAEVIGSEALLVAAPAAWSPGASEGVSDAWLRERPIVSLHEMHCLGRQIGGFCASRGLAAGLQCRTAQLATVLEMVGLGLGVSLVPEMAARADTSGVRAYLRVRGGEPKRAIALARRSDRALPRPAIALAGLLRSGMAGAGRGEDAVEKG